MRKENDQLRAELEEILGGSSQEGTPDDSPRIEAVIEEFERECAEIVEVNSSLRDENDRLRAELEELLGFSSMGGSPD